LKKLIIDDRKKKREILKEQDGRLFIGLIWIRIWTSDKLL